MYNKGSLGNKRSAVFASNETRFHAQAQKETIDKSSVYIWARHVQGVRTCEGYQLGHHRRGSPEVGCVPAAEHRCCLKKKQTDATKLDSGISKDLPAKSHNQLQRTSLGTPS